MNEKSRAVTLDELRDIPCPEPTETWCPIPHAVAVDHFIAAVIRSKNYGQFHEHLTVSGDGSQCFATFDLCVDILDGVTVAAGLRNSTDQSLALGVCVGERVIVCDNLAFAGEFAVFRRHTKGILDDLPVRMNEAVAYLERYAKDRRPMIEWMQWRGISDERAHDLFIKAIDADAMKTRDLAEALAAWRAGSPAWPVENETPHPFAARTLWSWYNAVTAASRQHFDRYAMAAADRTLNLNRMLSREFAPVSFHFS